MRLTQGRTGIRALALCLGLSLLVSSAWAPRVADAATASVGAGVLSVIDLPAEQGAFALARQGADVIVQGSGTSALQGGAFSGLLAGPGCVQASGPTGPSAASYVRCPATAITLIHFVFGGSLVWREITTGGVTTLSATGSRLPDGAPPVPVDIPVTVDGSAAGDYTQLPDMTAPVHITGAGGNDSLSGGAGDDVVDGGEGNDELWAAVGVTSGRSGRDTLIGGPGDDVFGVEPYATVGARITCGPGNDTFTAPGTLLPGNTVAVDCPPVVFAGKQTTATMSRGIVSLPIRLSRPARGTAVLMPRPHAGRAPVLRARVRPTAKAFTLRFKPTASERAWLDAHPSARWMCTVALKGEAGANGLGEFAVRVRPA